MLILSRDLTEIQPMLEEIIQEDCKGLIEQLNLIVFGCTLKTKSEIHSALKLLPLEEFQLGALIQILERESTSFSWGVGDVEVVILVFDDLKEAQMLNKAAMSGLVIHEIMHSIHRQRGLEDDLKRSMNLSLDFFHHLADLIPSDRFPKDKIVEFLAVVGSFATFVLKDFYVNTEMIKRGFASQIIEFTECFLGITCDRGVITPPEFEVPYEKGKIVLESFDELAIAINFTMSLLPSWVPLAKLNILENEITFSRAEVIKEKIFEYYYKNLTDPITQFLRFVDIYLTEFSYNKSFHRVFYGAFFNVVLELILGEDFNFYHLSKISELLEEIYPDKKSLEKQETLELIIKASYMLYQLQPAHGIQEENCKALEKQTREILSAQDLKDFKEYIATEPDFKVKNLLELAFFRTLTDLRVRLLDEELEDIIKTTCRALLLILTVLQSVNSSGKHYVNLKNRIYQLLTHKYRIFHRIRLVCKTELFTKRIIFTGLDHDLTDEQCDELIYNLRFFEVMTNNDVFELALKFASIINTTLENMDPKDKEFVSTLAMMLSAIASKELESAGEDTKEQAVPILRATLLALGFTFKQIRRITNEFGNIFQLDI